MECRLPHIAGPTARVRERPVSPRLQIRWPPYGLTLRIEALRRAIRYSESYALRFARTRARRRAHNASANDRVVRADRGTSMPGAPANTCSPCVTG